VVASADGGKTWTRITNTFNFHVVWVAGRTLYGAVFGPDNMPVIQTSTDNGAHWQPLNLPPLPNERKVDAEIPGGLLPAADGTTFASELGGTIAYLRAGSWMVLPFSSRGFHVSVGIRGDRGPLGTVTFSRDGRPARVWVFNLFGTGSATSPTLYRHDVQLA
jgi:hypothetical protein